MKLKLNKILLLGALVSTSLIASSLTVSCHACHGKNFEKKAMGISAVVKDLNSTSIVTALKGYQDGTYGGKMKGLMRAQVAKLSDKDINSIASEISEK